MRWRPWFWLSVSLCCFVAAWYFWHLGDKWAAQKAAAAASSATNQARPAGTPVKKADTYSALLAPMRLLSQPGHLNSWPEPPTAKTNLTPRLAYRLTNSSAGVSQLARSEHGLLLENALLDTTKPTPAIPPHLQAPGDPGSYIVQARQAPDNAFRAALKAAGGEIVSYIPNNAYLVRGSKSFAGMMQADSQVQAVLPYEPYYKIKPLTYAVEQKPLPPDSMLNVLLFKDARDATLGGLADLGAQVVAEERSPFGPVVRIFPPPDGLASVARLPGVQEIELAHRRVQANDLSRAELGVSPDSVSLSNYMGLSGLDVMVAVADAGVDATHPDLASRVVLDAPADGLDASGHGTHVAGIIAGDGTKSDTVTNAQGSIMPGTNGQFRGKAPGARLYSMDFNLPDYTLQEKAARTNALISNNSWTYGTSDYDLAAASYDAAVRDSVPERTGSQSLIYVFPAGNGGGANHWDSGVNDIGLGGDADTILSPGTAKNVITVGAVEQPRYITNQTYVCPGGSAPCETNQPWYQSTDSSNQVANFSSRGNVGIGIESDAGRFKPDVVAPGTFIVSTRSGQWDQGAYYNPTNYKSFPFYNLQLNTNDQPFVNGLLVPNNTVQLIVVANSTSPNNVDLPVTVTSPSGARTTGLNMVSIPPDGALDPVGDFWTYEVTNPSPQSVAFNVTAILVTTNDHGNFLDELRTNLNDTLGQYYRYESGTSMAAADASGILALMEEYFRGFQRTNSPALMKALLINGARSLGSSYDFQVRTPINLQGWGQIFLPTTLQGSLSNSLVSPRSAASMFMFEQDPTNALATGQSYTRFFQLSTNAQAQHMRVTLAWTDPPGDPVAGIKLVNDLDLVVTKLETGEVFYGNDIRANNDFNLPWNTNNPPLLDFVNNVENVYLKEPLGSNYSVTVSGHRVNVNAVTANPDNVVQDYALVVSSGDGQVPDALTLSPQFQNPYVMLPNVFVVTNQFPPDPENPVTGGLLLHQRVGANTPLLGTNTVPFPTDANAVITAGMTNQWHFYVLSNDMDFTNASFVTFLPPNLAVPRMGVTNVQDPTLATRPEADIDLYVSTDFTLTNLDTNAIAAAEKSVGRKGTEFIVLSNVAPKAVYYVGVKSEDQMAADYSFLGIFSLLPPSSSDTNGNLYVRGMPVPSVIPPGVPPAPQAAMVLGIATSPLHIRRVIVTNTITHSLPGGLLGTLSHGQKFDVLNNHTCATDLAGNCITNTHNYIYEDNGEQDPELVGLVRHSDGPGDLKEFIGEEGLGVWLFTMVNNFPASTGVVNRVMIKLEKQNLDTNGVVVTIQPRAWHYDSIDVPPDATNLTICISGNTSPLELYVSRNSIPSTNSFDYHLTVNPPGDCLPITIFDTPPLTAGRYYIGVFNPNALPETVRIVATTFKNPFGVASTLTSSTGPVTIQDDAVTYAYITNLSHLAIGAIDVGLLISDLRISDLAITLISPNGTRVLLFEDRGALSTNGLGSFSAFTNSLGVPVFATTNLVPFYTNNFDDVATGPYTPGATFDGWNVLSNSVRVFPELPAPWLSNNVLLLASGAVSNNLPTTNATSYSLSFEVTHAPYLVGTVGWWPLDGDAADIFGGFNGLLFGDVSFNSHTGMVSQAFFGDGVATRMVVPRAPALDVGKGRGFSVEGWVRPDNITNSAPLVEWYNQAATNPAAAPGVELWLSGGFTTNGTLGSLSAVLWDTNSQPHFIETSSAGGGLTNNGWQHVALTFNAADSTARLYTNGQLAAAQPVSPTNFVPRTSGDLYFGYDPAVLPTPVSYPNFFAPAGLNLVGNASITNGILRVAPSAEGQRGDAWYVNKVRCGGGLDTRFQFRISDLGALPGTPLGADGFSFTVQNEGPSSPHFYANLGDGLSHVSVFFNTFRNWPGCNDPVNCDASDNSVGVVTNGSYVAQQDLTPLGINLKDGNVHEGHISFDGTALNVWVDNIQVLGNVRVPGLAPGTDSLGRAWVGFSAGTGAAWENHDILNWTLGAPTPGTALAGGLDEFGLYDRPLSDCEVDAIYKAGTGGKYNTNVLSCPVTNQVQLVTAFGPQTYTFVNGLTWTNGPQWETNTIVFANLLQSAYPNGPATNLTSITVTPLDPNVAADNFVLSAVLTNYLNGLLHFTENTNVALVPIKFAPAPYMLTNFPPTLFFTNEFESATQRLYAVGSTIPGTTNDPAVPVRDWTVISGPVTVLSNSFFDAFGTNFVALGGGGVQCTLPTAPGHRYQVDYSVRGPGMVSWWNGDVEPLSQRAWDLIGGNNGAFLHRATNSATGLVKAPGTTNTLVFPGLVDETNHLVSKIEVGDPANLHLTNSFTIEGWIRPSTRTNFTPEGVEQILFRGDSRDCLDPYWFGVERVSNNRLDLVFHVETGTNHDCGVILETSAQPVLAEQWQHVAAVFERNVQWTNNAPWPTNEMRLYINGRRLLPENQEVFLEDPILGFVNTDFTSQGPFGDLDPAFSPGVSIGARSRADNTEEFYGSIDELSVYGRALTDPEIAAIAANGPVGKADFRVHPADGLAKVGVFLNDVLMDVGYGNNTAWTPHSFPFIADRTNMVLALQSLEPGTIIDGITLTELPEELNYLPEESLSVLNGQDGFGVWKLELWDTRTGLAMSNGLPTLLNWQLNFNLLPSNPPPVIELVHGIPYTNRLTAFGYQNFVVQVPQWATNATNILEFAADRTLTNLLPVGVFWSLTNQVPLSITNAIFWPAVTGGTNVLATDTNTLPYMVPGQAYYLTITNPNPVAVTFAYGVWYDILSLTNCQPLSNFVWQAGIPRYFQFDIATNAIPPGDPVQEVTFLLTGVASNYVGLGSNVTVVLSQHLPLPDLTHFDYMSHLADTNNDIILVTTNTTPFPIQTNRWYVGVFNNTYTNVPFIVQACYTTLTNYPVIIPLTNGLPFVQGLADPFVAPPGPPEWFFFKFAITNYVDGVLFELYNLSGDADLVLQRDVVPGMAPYLASSSQVGKAPEQIVLRTSAELPDLRGNWYLGVFNNESNNVAYTLRAVVERGGMLQSGQPLQASLARMATPPGGLLFSWNSIVGEAYVVQFTPTLAPPAWRDVAPAFRATTVLSTMVVPIPSSGLGFYRVIQVPQNYLAHPQLSIRLATTTNNLVRISWSTAFPNETLQYTTDLLSGIWANVNLPVTVEGNEFVVYDVIGPVPKFYRLIP